MNPYDVLSIDKEAEIKEIKQKYKELSLKFHPDKNRHLNEDDKSKN